MADLTVYVPEDVAVRARAARIPLSRATRAMLLAMLRALEGDWQTDPVAEIYALMVERGLAAPEDG